MGDQNLEAKVAELESRVVELERTHTHQRHMKYVMYGAVILYIISVVVIYSRIINSLSI